MIKALVDLYLAHPAIGVGILAGLSVVAGAWVKRRRR